MGSKEGILHISMAYLNEGDEVLIPNPGYPTYTSVSKLVGAKAIFYDLSEEGNWLPNFDELEQKDLSKVKIMWVNYPHMPTGASATDEVFKQKPRDWSNKQWKEYLADRKGVFNPKTGEIEEYIKRGSGIGYKKTGNVIQDQAYIDEYNKQQQQQQQQEQEEANKKQWEKQNKKQLNLNKKIEKQEEKKNPKLKWDGTSWVKNPNYNPNWKAEQGWKELEFPG